MYGNRKWKSNWMLEQLSRRWMSGLQWSVPKWFGRLSMSKKLSWQELKRILILILKIWALTSFMKFECFSWMSLWIVWLRFAQWNCRIVQRSSFEQKLSILSRWTENFADSVSGEVYDFWLQPEMYRNIWRTAWAMSMCTTMSL